MKKNKQYYYRNLFPTLLLIATLFMSIGYAVSNSVVLGIGGEISVLEQNEVLITDVSYKSDVNAEIENSKIITTYHTMMNSSIALSKTDNTSSITYTITMYNKSENDYIFMGVKWDKEFYDNENIVFDITLADKYMITSKQSVTFDITFKYASGITPSSSINVLESYLNFNFVRYVATYEAGAFEYTGGIVEFTAKEAGKYFLQVWGAKGGSASGTANGTYKGGAGGYSEGYINLEENEKLYVVIGEAGKDIHQDDYLQEDGTYLAQGTVPGGYNGGGNGYSNVKKYIESPGGGATHIAKTNRGELFNYSDYKEEVIIVAGGGGGSNYESASWNCSNGGAGGGLTSPNVSHGGNGTAYGASTIDETPGTGGSFGKGASGSDYPTKLLPGAGGGYYGGGFVTKVDGTINSNKGSSGGSGYIGGVYDGTSIDGKNSIPTYDGESTMTGNFDNGYAKITFIEKIYN